MLALQLLAVLGLAIPATYAYSPPAARAVHDDHLAKITDRPQLVRRDALPTITLGPDDGYNDKPQSTPAVTGDHVSLVARKEPKDGVDVFLADDVSNNVKKIVDDKCKKSTDPDCHSSVSKALNPHDFDIQARQLGALALLGIWGVGFAAAVLIHLYKTDSTPKHVHFPANDISSLSSYASSSTIVFATAGDDPDKVTATQVGDGANPTAGAAVSTAAADGKDFHKGDLVISLPKDLGDKVHDIIAQSAQCAKKRSTSLDCVGSIANMVMRQALPKAPLRGLVDNPVKLPSFKPPDLDKQLQNIIDDGKKIDGLSLDDEGLAYLSEVSFWITYEQIYEHKPAVTMFVIPASVTASGKTTTTSCPPDDRQPNCSNCGTHSEKDAMCVDPWKGCPCVDGLRFNFVPYDNQAHREKAQAVFKDLPDLKDVDVDEEAPGWCRSGSDPPNSGSDVRMIPIEFCQCGDSGVRKVFSTTDGKDGPCGYTKAPGPTIERVPWSAQTFDGQTCSFPSTTRCATFNHKERRGEGPAPTAMPALEGRAMMPVPNGNNGPLPTPVGDQPVAHTCSCVV